MRHAVILDDLLCRHVAFTAKYGEKYDIMHCYNVVQFMSHVLTYPGVIDLVSLDHDLGDTGPSRLTGNGMDAVQFLMVLPEYLRPVHVKVHSHNYARAEVMTATLQKSYDSSYETFTDE
jgi:hypothetical protein